MLTSFRVAGDGSCWSGGCGQCAEPLPAGEECLLPGPVRADGEGPLPGVAGEPRSRRRERRAGSSATGQLLQLACSSADKRPMVASASCPLEHRLGRAQDPLDPGRLRRLDPHLATAGRRASSALRSRSRGISIGQISAASQSASLPSSPTVGSLNPWNFRTCARRYSIVRPDQS